MRTLVSLVAAVSTLAVLPGCSATQSVTAAPQAKGLPMTSACFTAHGGRSADMDAAIQRNGKIMVYRYRLHAHATKRT